MFKGLQKENGVSLFIGIFGLLLLGSCSKSLIVKEWKSEQFSQIKQSPGKFIIFIQSNNQINSRIAQDQMVREFPYSSIQGYLYTKGNPINEGNLEYYKTKMNQEGIQYAILGSLEEINQAIDTTYSGFFADYFECIGSKEYNPLYSFGKDEFKIELRIYNLDKNECIWRGITRDISSKDFENINSIISTVLKSKITKSN